MAKKKSAKTDATKSKKKSDAKAAAKSPKSKDSKKAAKKGAKKGAKKAGKKSGKSLAPTPVKTGKGATPAEIGSALVAHVNSGAHDDMPLWKQHFHKGFVSIEGQGLAWTGIKAVKAKSDAWTADHAVHACTAKGPFVGATGFAVLFDMDVEVKATGQRMKMQEVGVYTVKNGKVVAEEFMYGGM